MPRRSKGTLPVRDVGRRTRRPGKAYIVPTERNPNGVVAAESRLERNHLLLLSLLPGVRRLSDQALCIDLDNQQLLTSRDQLPVVDGRKASSYTPDSEAEMSDGTLCIFESKPADSTPSGHPVHAYPAGHSTHIRPPVPRPSGRAVGAQRR